MWGERTLTLPDFHDDFHGSALAHASLPVLQALDRSIGGRWRGGGGMEGGEEKGVKDRRREESMEGEETEKAGKRGEEGERRWHTG